MTRSQKWAGHLAHPRWSAATTIHKQHCKHVLTAIFRRHLRSPQLRPSRGQMPSQFCLGIFGMSFSPLVNPPSVASQFRGADRLEYSSNRGDRPDSDQR
jgi:hypothetical protein